MKGYTLVESVMVIVVIGIVAAVGVPLLIETVDAWSYASRFQDNAVTSAIVAANRMSREMRRLRDDSAFAFANATQLTFFDTANTTITYTVSGTTLMRNADGLADNIDAFAITYYDDTGSAIASPIFGPSLTDIRRVSVDFSVRAGSNSLPFRFQVRPQNTRRLNEKFK